MRTPAKFLTKASAVMMLLGAFAIAPTAMAVDADLAAKGKKIAEDRKKGNCFTCHAYKDAFMAGNIGPALDGIGKRKSREEIYNQIFDATKANPNSSMPPFGKYEALSKDEVNAVTEWVMSL